MIEPSRLLRSNLLHSDHLRRVVPAPVKALLKRQMPYADFRSDQLRREAEHLLGGSMPIESDYASACDAVLGIFFDNSYTFAFNVAACRELRVRFKVIDLMASDWLGRVVDSRCDAFLATPPLLLGLWRRVFEERLWVIANDLNRRLCPTFEELYLWESKRRMRDWLVAHDVPHPVTWVFFDRAQALEFCGNTEYPVVCKTDSGAASSGVFVLRDRRAAERMVDLAFGRGILPRSTDPRARESGFILFQEFVSHDFEWRITRVGDDFFCRRKVRTGDHASGSGRIGHAAPLPGMLDFARQVTDAGGFRSMAVDMFENTNVQGHPYLVNELQAIIGARNVDDNVDAGRWRFDVDSGSWAFERGCFYRNVYSNLRIEDLLNAIGKDRGVSISK